VVREGVGEGGEMTQALYAHMNNKITKKRIYFFDPKYEHSILTVSSAKNN
jgi:hypothetical protein